jgi:hypothetical protein
MRSDSGQKMAATLRDSLAVHHGFQLHRKSLRAAAAAAAAAGAAAAAAAAVGKEA